MRQILADLPTFHISLPTGASFSSSPLLTISATALDSESLAKSPLPAVPASDGTILARASINPRSFKRYGPTYYLQPSGVAKMAVMYKEGDRDGPMLIFDSLGQWLFFGEYIRDNPNGFFCLFQDGRPWLLQRWEKSRLESNWLIVNGAPTERPANDPEIAQAQQNLDAVLETAKQDEAELKRTMIKLEDEMRSQWAAQQAVINRAQNINKAAEQRLRGIEGGRRMRPIK
jgi:hypothetical protein